MVLFPRQSQDVSKLIVELLCQKSRLAGIHKGIQEKDIILLKNIAFLSERRFDSLRRGRHRWAGTMGLGELEVAGKVVNHGAEDNVQRLLLVVNIKQVMDVRDADLGGEARVNGAALGAFLVEAFIGVIGINEVFRGNPQRLEVSAEDGVHGVHVENARNPDAKVLALFHQLEALLLLGSDRDPGQRIGNHRAARMI